MGKRKGRCSRKNKHVGGNEEPEELTRAPHSFVVHRYRNWGDFLPFKVIFLQGEDWQVR